MKITSEPPIFPHLSFLTRPTLIRTDMFITLIGVGTVITLSSFDTATASPPLRKTTTQPASQLYRPWLLFEVVKWRGCG